SGLGPPSTRLVEQHAGRFFSRTRLIAAGAVGVCLGLALLIFVLSKHEPAVDPDDGDQFPSGRIAGTFWADGVPARERFDWQPKELVAVLGEHRWRHWEMVKCLAISPDGRWAASGSRDETIRVWDLTPGADGRTDRVLSGHTSTVMALAFSPD